VTFWQKDIGKKSVHKMLMKLTLGVNFILRVHFEPKKLQIQNVIREKLLKALLYKKFVHKMLMKLTIVRKS